MNSGTRAHMRELTDINIFRLCRGLNRIRTLTIFEVESWVNCCCTIYKESRLQDYLLFFFFKSLKHHKGVTCGLDVLMCQYRDNLSCCLTVDQQSSSSKVTGRPCLLFTLFNYTAWAPVISHKKNKGNDWAEAVMKRPHRQSALNTIGWYMGRGDLHRTWSESDILHDLWLSGARLMQAGCHSPNKPYIT